MGSTYSDLLIVSQSYGRFEMSDDRAWALADCSNCGGAQMAVIALDRERRAHWMRCVNCRQPVISIAGAIYPPTKPLGVPLGLVGVELAAWTEVRECLSAGATTAAVMMCRKLLLHVAVAQGLPEQDAKGRAPSFVAAVQHLEKSGIITEKMRPWVDRVKDVGNEANHQIQPVDQNVALDVARFTEQLLRLAYEMDALMGQPDS